jgi:hypothetical protein
VLAFGAYWTDPLGPMHGMTTGIRAIGAISPFCTGGLVGCNMHGMYTGVVAIGTDCSTSVNGALALLLGRGGRGGIGIVGGSRTVEGLSALGAAATLGVRLGLAVLRASCGAGVSTSPRFTIRSSVGDGDGSHDSGGKVV